MPASVQIVEKNGAGPTVTDKTGSTIRHKMADDPTANSVNPMAIPGAGSAWSYEKWIRMRVASGTYTEITNLVAYTDGATGFGTGVSWWWKAVTAYATPTQPSSSSGYTAASSYTSGSPLVLGAGPFTGTGEKGDHLVMLLQVQDTASPGTLTGETLTIAWEEI